MIQKFANPARFNRFARIVMPIFATAAAVLLCAGFYTALLASPPDYQQGESVRIMYVHVPAAWMSLFIYTSMAVAAFCGIVWKHILADLYVRAAAPVGAAFTFLCLATGSLWGKPMWGTWWAWDARLTSVLILFFFYMGYIVLVDAFDDEQRGITSGNYLLIAGVVNVPIVKFSVDWWNTLHQPASLTKMSSPSIDPAMLLPLLLMGFGYMAFFGAIALMRVQTEMKRRRKKASAA